MRCLRSLPRTCTGSVACWPRRRPARRARSRAAAAGPGRVPGRRRGRRSCATTVGPGRARPAIELIADVLGELDRPSARRGHGDRAVRAARARRARRPDRAVGLGPARRPRARQAPVRVRPPRAVHGAGARPPSTTAGATRRSAPRARCPRDRWTRSSPTWTSSTVAAAQLLPRRPCSATSSPCCGCCGSATTSPRPPTSCRIVLTHFELGERVVAVDGTAPRSACPRRRTRTSSRRCPGP